MRRGCYSIGQFARRASVSVTALRFYDGAELKGLVAAGADPAGAEAQAWAAERHALIRAFTGGHPEVEAGLKRMWENVAAMPAEHRPPPMQLPSEAEQEFTRRALEAYQRAGG